MAEMLTAKDLQDLLHVDRSTVYRMAEAGRLPALKVGRQWRFPADQIHQWLAAQATVAHPPSAVLDRVPLLNAEIGLVDLLPLDCVQLMQDTFARALGVMIVITDMEGKPVTEVSNPCGFFSSLMPVALEKCVEQWHEMATVIDLEPKFVRSHLHLLCSRGLIRVGPELKGMLFVGGIAPDDWPPHGEQLQKVAGELGVFPKVIAAHADEVYRLDGDQKAHVLSLVQPMANVISHIISERSALMGKLEAIADLTTA